ncbi:hypothetical protein ABZ322_30855, partial [Streptomyces sp. NPDC006129]
MPDEARERMVASIGEALGSPGGVARAGVAYALAHRDGAGGTDVCALGRRYGGWRADSPEATICQDTYGR